MADLAEVIVVALAGALDVEPERIVPDASLYDDLGADSLAVMEILGALEDELGIELPDSTAFALELRTVQDVIGAFVARSDP